MRFVSDGTQIAAGAYQALPGCTTGPLSTLTLVRVQCDRISCRAGAELLVYGRVYMIGKESIDSPWRLWQLVEGALVDDGPFEVTRLRYS